MERVNFIQHKEKAILLEDFSNLKPDEEFYNTVEKAANIIRSQPPKSVLALLDATNAHFDTNALNKMSEFVKGNTPYVKCAVVVGITGLLKIALTSLSKIAGRPFHIFPAREEALDFLIKQ